MSLRDGACLHLNSQPDPKKEAGILQLSACEPLARLLARRCNYALADSLVNGLPGLKNRFRDFDLQNTAVFF